jgi:hypothetical protein
MVESMWDYQLCIKRTADLCRLADADRRDTICPDGGGRYRIMGAPSLITATRELPKTDTVSLLVSEFIGISRSSFTRTT